MKVDWVPIGDLLELQRRDVDVRPDRDYQEIGVRSFGKGVFIKPPVLGAELGDKRVFAIREGDFVVSNVFAWEGAVGVATKEHVGLIGSHRFMTWTPRGEVNVDYLRHYFGSEAGVASLGKASPGSAGRNRTLSIKNFERLLVPLPERGKQERITGHLTKLEPITRPSTAEPGAIVERLVSAAVNHAARAPLGDLLRPHRPWMEVESTGSYRAIGVRGFGRGMIRYPEGGAETLSKLRYYPLTPGALIVSNIKGWEGAVCVAAESDAGRIASNRFLQYIPKDPRITTGWVEQYLLSPAGLASLNAASPGSADRNRTLSMAAFEAIEIPVPPLKTQESVMRVVRALRGVSAEQTRRDELAAAVLPAARNEIFNSMR